MKTITEYTRQTVGSKPQIQSPTILVTGATGTIGTELTKLLSERRIPFRALVRAPQDAGALISLAECQIVPGDFNDPKTIAEALVGIERVFLLTNSSEHAQAQQLRFVAEARRAGVRHIVKLSQFAADVNSPVRFLRYHAVVERAIQQADMSFTFLRPNLFMQGLLGFRDLIRQGKFMAPIGDAPISLVDVRDIAAVAAATLTEAGHSNKTYTITGPQALTHAQMAETLTTVLKHPVTFTDIPPDAMRGALMGAGFPDWQVAGLIEDYAHYSRSEATAVTSTVYEVTGQPPRTFADFTRDYAPIFS